MQTIKSSNYYLNYKSIVKNYGTLGAGFLIIMGFAILSPYSFANLENAINITRQISFLAIIAIGATLIMAIGEFDLSVGAMASFSGVFAAKLSIYELPIWICFLVPLIVAFLVGIINGYIVTRFKVLSFITTLASGTILSGITFRITKGATVFENIPETFRYVGQTDLKGIPLLSMIMILLTIIFGFIMTYTTFGRKLYAIGGNERASRVAGVSIVINKNMAFGLCAALAALSGILMASRLGSAHPTGGDGLFLSSYAAVFLGITVFKRGMVSVWGTFIGAAILGILANGLTILEVPSYMQDIITGIIIIASVIMQKIGGE